jgi:hypothetical protein
MTLFWLKLIDVAPGTLTLILAQLDELFTKHIAIVVEPKVFPDTVI